MQADAAGLRGGGSSGFVRRLGGLRWALAATVALLVGCASTGVTKDYAGTAYGRLERADKELLKSISDNPNDYWAHFDIFEDAFRTGRYGVALFALIEMKRLRRDYVLVDYHMGLVFDRLGVAAAAEAKMLYASEHAENVFVRNRGVAALIDLENGKELSDAYVVRGW